MRKRSELQSGVLKPRSLFGLTHSVTGLFLVMLGFAFEVPKASAQSVGGTASFTAVGSMISARYFHTATLLGNGKVLITGGTSGGGNVLNTAELFDPDSGTFVALSNTLTAPRFGHTATLLPSGKVLITGGSADYVGAMNTAELFDPVSMTFSPLPSMTSKRALHTATLLPNGKVLLAGGLTSVTPGAWTNTAELFDPATATFTPISAMTVERSQHTANLLSNGKVLIAGGRGTFQVFQTAELFDPITGTFSAITNFMNKGRWGHASTTLANGKVLLSGGAGSPDAPVTAEVFDPDLATFTQVSTPMSLFRSTHSSTLLPNGKVLIAGGSNDSSTADEFDPTTGTLSPLPNLMTSKRFNHTATLLPNGKVFFAGGADAPDHALNTAEVFDSTSPAFTPLLPNTMTAARYNTAATLLPSGNILITGGADQNMVLNTAELFNAASGTFTVLPNTMTSARFIHTATLLGSGKVLIAGGFSNRLENTAELFDPPSATFVPVPSTMSTPRYWHTATLLPSGKVLIAGGYNGTGPTSSADLFDPASATFVSLPPMHVARHAHSATLLTNGKVLVAGGYTPSGATNAAELFDPVTGTFELLSTMSSARFYHTATLLPNGKVLFTGGSTGASFSNTAELFDPVSQTFTALSNTMNLARYWHTATQLPSGKVLIVGGYTPVGIALVVTNTAELFDPALETFTLVPSTMSNGRANGSTITVLTNGEVLVTGGIDGNTIVAETANNTADLFNEGLGFSESRRPVISNAPALISQLGQLVLDGSGFRGNLEASGGSFEASTTNYPLLHLMRIDNEQSFFVPSDPATNWSDTSFTSSTLSDLPIGQYRVTIITNAIPSLSKIISIVLPVQVANILSRKNHGSAGAFDIDLPLTGNPGIECRSGSDNGIHTLVFRFSNTLDGINPVSSVTASATTRSGPQPVTASGHLGSDTHEYFVDLSGVPNESRVSVTLHDVTDSVGNFGEVSANMDVLYGDVNQSGNVDAADVGQVQRQNNQAVTTSNFLKDVNISGNIDAADVGQVQRQNSKHL